uniref:Uncharacterized protein n=1 Tax=Arundo donax TaxID=35708 RepID=A0A0A8Z1D0_ARUDO
MVTKTVQLLVSLIYFSGASSTSHLFFSTSQRSSKTTKNLFPFNLLTRFA